MNKCLVYLKISVYIILLKAVEKVNIAVSPRTDLQIGQGKAAVFKSVINIPETGP
jgi:hypothetical protein